MKKKLKVLLLQIRESEIVRIEEHESFAKYGGLEKDQIGIHNVFDSPHFDEKILTGYDGLFIGGASEASVLEIEKYPFVTDIIKLCQWSVKNDFPVFASCFGFQAAVLAFGGQITRDTEDFEIGTYPLQISETASHDPVMQNTPDNFMAVSVHQEKATELPPNCELLVYNQNCIHSFRYKRKPFWAFQFHPELDRACLTQRLNVYREKYTENKDHFQHIIENLSDTPDSNDLVLKFINYLNNNLSRK